MRFDSQRQRRRVFSRNIPPSLGAIAREHDSRLCFPEAACVKLFQTLLYSLEGRKKRKGVEGFHRRALAASPSGSACVSGSEATLDILAENTVIKYLCATRTVAAFPLPPELRKTSISQLKKTATQTGIWSELFRVISRHTSH